MTNTISVKDLRIEFERRKGQRDQLASSIESAKERSADLEGILHQQEKAREVIREVALKTQQALAYHISDISSLALESIFDDPYELQIDFVQRRNKTEADLYFTKHDEVAEPMEASGGGAIDVAAFALRVASWSMERPKSRSIIVLDEPMKFLSKDLQHKASAMIEELARKLDLQFLIVTHEEELTENADQVFRVIQRKQRSKVKNV